VDADCARSDLDRLTFQLLYYCTIAELLRYKMATEPQTLRDWHRLFGLLLSDFFTGSPFVVEVERDMSVQQQFLDVVIVRRGQGEFVGRLPDGLEEMVLHNLLTFKSHHESLDSWAVRELIGHYVAYRKIVSASTSDLLPEEQFRLYAICARFPERLSTQVPWQKVQSGVYDCKWGIDTIRIVVAKELSREAHNAALHLFSASPELVGYGQLTYKQRAPRSSSLLGELLVSLKREGFTMYTMEDFQLDLMKKYFPQLTPQEREEVLHTLPPETILGSLSEDQIREYLDKLTASRKKSTRKPRRKK
jgi:hypothetical protein